MAWLPGEGFSVAEAWGVGLGLAITKGIIEAHGGEMEVRSRFGVDVDVGTTVFVRLPHD